MADINMIKRETELIFHSVERAIIGIKATAKIKSKLECSSIVSSFLTLIAAADDCLQQHHMDECRYFTESWTMQKPWGNIVDDRISALNFERMAKRFQTLNGAPVVNIEKVVFHVLVYNIFHRLKEFLGVFKSKTMAIHELVDPSSLVYFSIAYDYEHSEMRLTNYSHVVEMNEVGQLSKYYRPITQYMQPDGNQTGNTASLSGFSEYVRRDLKSVAGLETQKFRQLATKKLRKFHFCEGMLQHEDVQLYLILIICFLDKTWKETKKKSHLQSGNEELTEKLFELCGLLLDQLPARFMVVERSNVVSDLTNDIIYLIDKIRVHYPSSEKLLELKKNINKIQTYIEIWRKLRANETSFVERERKIRAELLNSYLRTNNYGNTLKDIEVGRTYLVDIPGRQPQHLTVLNHARFKIKPAAIDIESLSASSLQKWAKKISQYESIESVIENSPIAKCGICHSSLPVSTGEIAVMDGCSHLFCFACVDYCKNITLRYVYHLIKTTF